jgi:hypothetical protein
MSANECIPKSTITIFQKNEDKYCPEHIHTYSFVQQEKIESYLNFTVDSK